MTGWEYRVSKPPFGLRFRQCDWLLTATHLTYCTLNHYTSHILHIKPLHISHITHYNVATKHAPVERARPLTLFLENDISDSPETLSGGDAFCCSRATWIHWTSPGRARKHSAETTPRWWEHRGRKKSCRPPGRQKVKFSLM